MGFNVWLARRLGLFPEKCLQRPFEPVQFLSGAFLTGLLPAAMIEDELEAIKQSLIVKLDMIPETAYVGLITFGTVVQVIISLCCPSTHSSDCSYTTSPTLVVSSRTFSKATKRSTRARCSPTNSSMPAVAYARLAPAAFPNFPCFDCRSRFNNCSQPSEDGTSPADTPTSANQSADS